MTADQVNLRLRLALVLALGIGLAGLVFPGPVLAQSTAATMLNSFVSKTDGWWGLLRGYALTIFVITLTLEVVLFGVRIALQQTQPAEILGQFVMLLLFAGFIAAVINNYESWAKGIAINSLKPLAGELTGASADAGSPFALGSKVWDIVSEATIDAGFWDTGKVYLFLILALILVIIFALISALVILVTCEFYIVANVGVLLIGLGGSKIFKDYAINVMRYVLSVAIKLFILQLIINIGFSIINVKLVTANAAGGLESMKAGPLVTMIAQSIILLALAKSLPETCGGLLNGASIGGGNPLVSAAKSVGGVAAGMAGSVAGKAISSAGTAASALRTAHAKGAQGLGGHIKGAMQAHKEAKMNANPNTIRNQLKSQRGAAKAAAKE